MKNRILLSMLIVFIVLAGVWITCGTIFVVSDVEIVDTTVTADLLTAAEKDEILSKSGLKGKNILFNLDQAKITQCVKSVNPMLKLQSVTAQFPNHVTLQISRRSPVYYDAKNEFYFDAEMCRVNGTKAGCVDITGANLFLDDNLQVGDVAVGKNQQTQCKIEQLKILAGYFESLHGFDIAYDDETASVGSELVCLNLKIQPDVTFNIKIKTSDNFVHALEFTEQIYQMKQVNGVYKTRYRENGKVVTVIGVDQCYEE